MLVSKRIRNAFRECAPQISLSQIEKIWVAEGFWHVDYKATEGAQRQSLWDAFESSVDWEEEQQVVAVLRVYELILSDYLQSEGQYDRLSALLMRDGWEIDEYRRIVRIENKQTSKITLPHLDELKDASGIVEVLSRMELLIGTDNGGVVGASKELMEATAKTILYELEIPFSNTDQFPKLIPRVQEALLLSASKVDDSLDNSLPIRQVLEGLSKIAVGMNQLRNTDGSGHGRHVATNLSNRHARLSINVSTTWCEAILDTYFDPKAPWRSSK